MDMVEVPLWAQLLTPAMLFIQLAWYAVVIIFLVRIWQKVKHLPG